MLTQRRSSHIDEDHIAGPDHSAVSALLKRHLAADRDNQLIGLARITTHLRPAAHEPLGCPDPTDETIRRRALPSEPPMVAAFVGSSDPEGTMQTGYFLLPAQRRRHGARTNKAPDIVHDPDSDTTRRSRIDLGRVIAWLPVPHGASSTVPPGASCQYPILWLFTGVRSNAGRGASDQGTEWCPQHTKP